MTWQTHQFETQVKSTDQTTTVFDIIWVRQADIRATVAIGASYNQTVTLGGPFKLACFTLQIHTAAVTALLPLLHYIKKKGCLGYVDCHGYYHSMNASLQGS